MALSKLQKSLQNSSARYEKKFVVSDISALHFETWLKTHPLCFKQQYSPRIINSLYFDSPDLACYQENLAGISSRQKFRLRWYGSDKNPSTANFEVKSKRNELGWKDIFNIQFHQKLAETNFSNLATQIFEQLPSNYFNFYTADTPIILNNYQRAYYISFCGKIRVTIDSNLLNFSQLQKHELNYKNPVNTPEISILEVKYAAQDAIYTKEILSKIPFRNSKSSKYVIGVQAILGQ